METSKRILSEEHPDTVESVVMLALVYRDQGRYDDALEVYEKLVSSYPKDASYRLNLGLVHLKLGHPDEAIVELTRTRALDPILPGLMRRHAAPDSAASIARL